MLKHIYISRHGSRQDWINPAEGSSVTGMYHDPSLSAHGLEQAEHLGRFLANPPNGLPRPQMICSSGFYRCLQTSRPLAEALDLPVCVELGVGEWFSKARDGTGLHARPHHHTVLKKHFAPSYLHPKYESTVFPSRRGENLDELRDRIQNFVDVFIKRMDTEHPEVETVSLVAHAATVIALGRALLKDPEAKIRAGTTSSSLYTRASGNNWFQVLNGETSYLPDGEERSWSFDEVVFVDGKIIEDTGDGLAFNPEDELPVGVADAYKVYL